MCCTSSADVSRGFDERERRLRLLFPFWPFWFLGASCSFFSSGAFSGLGAFSAFGAFSASPLLASVLAFGPEYVVVMLGRRRCRVICTSPKSLIGRIFVTARS